MNDLKEALKTIMVYLNSLNIQTDITFNTQILDWFSTRGNVFDIRYLGKKAGIIKIHNSVPSKVYFALETHYKKMRGEVSLANPHDLTYDILTDSHFENSSLHGTFSINSRLLDNEEMEYFITIKGEKHDLALTGMREEQKISFALNDESLLKVQLETKYGIEQLQLYPHEKETNIAYSYDNKARDHHLGFSAKVGAKNQTIAGINIEGYYTEVTTTFDEVKNEISKYWSDRTFDSHKLMQKIYPHYQDIIRKLNESLEGDYFKVNWLAHLMDLAYPEYSDEEIKTITGIDREKCLLENQSETLSALYASEKVRKRILK